MFICTAQDSTLQPFFDQHSHVTYDSSRSTCVAMRAAFYILHRPHQVLCTQEQFEKYLFFGLKTN